MALAEKQLAWTPHHIQFNRGEHLSEQYLKINPNGVVPTLVHNGRVVTDSSVINEYLDEVFPEFPLRPHDPYGRAVMRIWRQYIDEVPTPSIRVPSFNAYFVPIWRDMSDRQFFEYTERLPLRKYFYRKMGRTGFPKEEVDAALERLNQTLARMEASLAGSAWIAGDDLSLADISVMPTVVRMEDLGLAAMWDDKPRVTDWYRRIQARPSFATTYMAGSRRLGPDC